METSDQQLEAKGQPPLRPKRHCKRAAAQLTMKKGCPGIPFVAQRLTNPTRIYEDGGLIPGLAKWVKDPALLWPWCRPELQLQFDP